MDSGRLIGECRHGNKLASCHLCRQVSSLHDAAVVDQGRTHDRNTVYDPAIAVCAERDALKVQLADSERERTALQKAHELLNAGFKSTCEQMHELKQTVRSLEAKLEAYAKAAPLCENHKPDGGARSGCLVCGLQEQSRALSAIDYAAGEPNDMRCSVYDTEYDEKAVVERVKDKLAESEAARLKAEAACAAMRRELQNVVTACPSDDVTSPGFWPLVVQIKKVLAQTETYAKVRGS